MARLFGQVSNVRRINMCRSKVAGRIKNVKRKDDGHCQVIEQKRKAKALLKKIMWCIWMVHNL